MLQGSLPEVITSFDSIESHFNNEVYGKIIRQTLSGILPGHLFSLQEGGGRNLQEQGDHFHAILPYVAWTTREILPGNFSFFVISRFRKNAFRFFFEMTTHWLVPGKRLPAVSLFAADFQMPSISNEVYTLCEVIIQMDEKVDVEYIQASFSTWEEEVRLGMESSYYARRILEIKGVSADGKVAFIQDHITYLIKRLPAHFDYDLFSEMQHLFIMCRDEFMAARRTAHLSKIICTLYLFRKSMKEHIKLVPVSRQVDIKLFRTHLNHQPVLAIIVGVNFLKEKEVFEKHHLLAAVRTHISSVLPVEGSYMINRRGHESFCHLYLEVEKKDGSYFSSQEVESLRHELPLELKDLIEHPVHSIFMPRNEEEIMRNVLVLSSQIKYLRDIPQVVINFDEQAHSHLFFNVIFVRVVKPATSSLVEKLKASKTEAEYVVEKSKIVGLLRNTYPKEAIIFRVKLAKEPFLRRDHSIDLYKARQSIVLDLSRVAGDVRDFNGGMIAKQNEILSNVRDLLVSTPKYKEHFLENFFFSLMPPLMRTLIEPVAVATVFLMIQQLIVKKSLPKESPRHQVKFTRDFVFFVIRGGGISMREEISKCLQQLQLHPSEVATSLVRIYEIPYLGCIYRCDDEQKQMGFCRALENTVDAWIHKTEAGKKERAIKG